MGVRVVGMTDWLHDLETLPERAADKFPRMLGRGALNIKTDWKRRWQESSHRRGHIPHLIRSVDYHVSEHKTWWRAEIGANPRRALQTGLAAYISYGTPTSAPHNAGQNALDDEQPRFLRNVAELAEKLLGTQ